MSACKPDPWSVTFHPISHSYVLIIIVDVAYVVVIGGMLLFLILFYEGFLVFILRNETIFPAMQLCECLSDLHPDVHITYIANLMHGITNID